MLAADSGKTHKGQIGGSIAGEVTLIQEVNDRLNALAESGGLILGQVIECRALTAFVLEEAWEGRDDIRVWHDPRKPDSWRTYACKLRRPVKGPLHWDSPQ